MPAAMCSRRRVIELSIAASGRRGVKRSSVQPLIPGLVPRGARDRMSVATLSDWNLGAGVRGRSGIDALLEGGWRVCSAAIISGVGV